MARRSRAAWTSPAATNLRRESPPSATRPKPTTPTSSAPLWRGHVALCLGVDFDRLQVGRDGYVPAELGLHGLLQRHRGIRLSVDEKKLLRRRRHPRDPAQQFAAAGMGGKLGQVQDFGPYRNHFAMHVYELGAVLQRAPAGALRLKAHQQNAVAKI